MTLRSLFPALLLLGIPLELTAQSTPMDEKSKLVQKIIPVADLVTPVRDFDQASCLTASGGVTCCAQSVRKLDEELTRLIQTTIAYSSWKENGGVGTVDFYPYGKALVVNNKPEVIEQVVQFLDTMREPQNHQVVVEVRLISLTPATFEKMGNAPFCEQARQKECMAQWFQHRCITVNESEASKLLTGLQFDEKAQVLMTPKCTMFDGQKASIRIDNDQTIIGWKMQPRISADRLFTALSLTLNVHHNLHETVLCVPAGGYCLIGGLFTERTEFGPPVLSKIPHLNRLVKNVGSSNQHWVALVKVTPICATEVPRVQGLSGAVADAVKAAPISAEEAASAPNLSVRRDEILKNYFDACSRGDLRLIKKYHRELQKYAVEKQLAPHSADWMEQMKQQPRMPMIEERATTGMAPPMDSCTKCDAEMPTWETRWQGTSCDSGCPATTGHSIRFSVSLRFRTDEHANWNSKWFPSVELQPMVIEAEEEAGWAKPGPRKGKRLGIDQ